MKIHLEQSFPLLLPFIGKKEVLVLVLVFKGNVFEIHRTVPDFGDAVFRTEDMAVFFKDLHDPLG